MSLGISIITVTWNSKEHIIEQLRSVQRNCQDISYEHIIVDNHSSDNTLNVITGEKISGLSIIKNIHNVGFGTANNQGAKIARGQFLLFLNPDMRLEEGSLKKWIAWMRERPKVGVAGCRLLNQSGEINQSAMPRRFPTLFDQLMIILKVPHLLSSVLNNYLYRDRDFSVEQEVDSVRGSCMLVRRELVDKLGFAFDPRYYIWFEDVDLCREAKRFGFEVVYTPIVSATDLVGTSFRKRNFWWKQFQLIRSMIKYFWKWR